MDDKYLIKKKEKGLILAWFKNHSTFVIEIFIGLCLGIGTIINSCNQNSLIQEQTVNLNAQKELMQKQTILIEQQISNSFLFDSLQTLYTKKQYELADEELNNMRKEQFRKTIDDKKDLKLDIFEIDNLCLVMLKQMKNDATSHDPGTTWDQNYFGIKLTRIEKILQKYFNTDLMSEHGKNNNLWLEAYNIVREVNFEIGTGYSVESLRKNIPFIEQVKINVDVYLKQFNKKNHTAD